MGWMFMERMMRRHDGLEKSRHAVPSGAQTEAKLGMDLPRSGRLLAWRSGLTATSANATTGCSATGLARLSRAPTLKTEFMQTGSLNAPAKTRQVFCLFPSRIR